MTQESKLQSGALGVLFLAVFIDLLGFGIVIPLLPFWAESLGASPFIYGILVASYSAMQFIFAPLWGRISDSRGRRPVILVGLTGTIIGFGLLALTALVFTDSLLMLLISRLIGGIFTAATLPTSQAYIADTTTGKDRAKGFGLIGAAFGLGFAIGPAIGGFLSIGGYYVPALFATGLAVLNLLAAIRNLPESLPKEVREEKRSFKIYREEPTSGVFRIILSTPSIFLIIILFASISLSFSGMESTLALLGEVRFGLDEVLTGVVFLVVGIVAIVTQGGIIRPLSNKFADSLLIAFGFVFLVIGFAGLSTVASLIDMVVWVIPLAFGSSIANPTLGALLSKRAPSENAGEVLGINQGVGSLMRIVGPLFATFLFEINVAFPFYLGTILLGIGFILTLILITLTRDRTPESICLNCGNQLRQGVAICSKCGFINEPSP
ncbi:MAG: MFS transporter [Promethearchaeota archaeon]